MSFKATLAANAFYKISNVAVLFLVTVILSRAMGADGYGLLSLVILNVTLFNMLTSFGTDSGITYTTALNSKNINRIVTVSFGIILIQIFLLVLAEVICFLIFGKTLLLKTNDNHFWWLSVLFLVGISIQEKFTALLSGSHLYTQSNKAILLCNLFSLGVLAYLFFVRKTTGADTYLIAFILSNALLALTLVMLGKMSLHFALDFRIKRKDLILFFNYSFLVFITNLIQFLAYRADLWIVAHYRGEVEVGWYALAVRLAQLLWILPVLFASIVFPKVSSTNEDYNHNELLSLLRLLNAANFLGGLVLFLIVKPLLLLVFGQQYLPGADAFQILLPGVILFCNATILAAYFAGINELRKNLLGSVLCFISVVTLDFFLIPQMGFLGAAIASSIGYSLTAFYFVWQYCQQRNVSPALLFVPQKKDLEQVRLIGKSIFKTP